MIDAFIRSVMTCMIYLQHRNVGTCILTLDTSLVVSKEKDSLLG